MHVSTFNVGEQEHYDSGIPPGMGCHALKSQSIHSESVDIQLGVCIHPSVHSGENWA